MNLKLEGESALLLELQRLIMDEVTVLKEKGDVEIRSVWMGEPAK